jgi:AmmeMemoRadiSam system protein B
MSEDLNYSYYDWKNRELVIGKERLAMNFRIFYALKWMDGKTTNLEIRRKFKEKFNFELNGREFENIIKKIKDYDLLIKRTGCLISKLSEDFVNRQIKLFSRRRIRPAQYAGICYSDKKEELERSVQKCFDLINPISFKSKTKGINRLKGIIVPHSNLELSGSCAAWAYKAVEERPLPELLIILAPDHSLKIKTPFSISNQNYDILENVVKVDNEFIKLLKKDINFNIFNNNISQLIEHAVEIQLPFLLYIFRKNPEKLKIIPVICASEPKYDEKAIRDFRVKQDIFFGVLKKALYKTGKDVIFIATGDLMHVREKEASPLFHKKNKEIMSLLQETNADDLKLKLNSEYRSCGKWSFYSFLRFIEPAKSRVLNYSWAGKYKTVNTPYRNFVNIGYVSMVFY